MTGLKNPASANAFIVVDAFDVASDDGGTGGTPVRLEEDDPAITYTVAPDWFDRFDPAYTLRTD